jgi:hypothetical protein
MRHLLVSVLWYSIHRDGDDSYCGLWSGQEGLPDTLARSRPDGVHKLMIFVLPNPSCQACEKSLPFAPC